MIGRRAALGLTGALLARPALAAPPLNLALIVGAAAGTAADRWGRGIAPFLERHWPRSSVAVVNLAGGGGLVAARAVADALPDGRAIAAVTTPLLIARAITSQAEGLIERLDFLAAVAEEPVVLVVAPNVAPDLAALRAIGPQGRLGCPPPGSAGHLAGRNLAELLPLELIAFPAAGAARQAVLAGNLTAALLPLPDAITVLREQRLQAIALAGGRRSPLLPELPHFGEVGLTAAPVTQRGFALPRGVPADMRDRLAQTLLSVVEDPEYLAQSAAAGRTAQLTPAPLWDNEVRRLTRDLQQLWADDPWTALP